MYCPNCAEERVSTETVYCTRCGEKFAVGVSSGVRQAFVLAVIGLLMIPVWMFIGAAFPANDRFVESSPSTTWPEMLAWIGMWVFFIAAAARIGYAAIFERSVTIRQALPQSDGAKPTNAPPELNAGDNFRPAKGAWRETTTDLFESAYKPQRNSGEL